VVDRDRQDVLALIKTEQFETDERPNAKIEFTGALLSGQITRSLKTKLGNLGGNIYDGKFDIEARFDRLKRLAVDIAEHGAKRFVPMDHLVQSVVERINPQIAHDSHCARNVVGRRARVELIQKPNPPLGV
jgi:hypothetical protein